MSSTYERFRDICLSLPETSEVMVETWGHPTFRVGPKQKMFASCSAPDADQPSFGMKVEMAHQQALVQTDPHFSISPYVGKHGWIRYDATGEVDWDLIGELVVESYTLNAPKKLARSLSASGLPTRAGGRDST
jgi:predicted DNA-binding protein (MmcQ/YjbR family)